MLDWSNQDIISGFTASVIMNVDYFLWRTKNLNLEECTFHYSVVKVDLTFPPSFCVDLVKNVLISNIESCGGICF